MKSETSFSGRRRSDDTRWETCRICGKVWNVSAEAAYRPGDYSCPECSKKRRRDDAILPRRLRQLRERRGVASYVVSELCGLGRDALRRYELGLQTPGAEALSALADYYAVSVDWLLGRD